MIANAMSVHQKSKDKDVNNYGHHCTAFNNEQTPNSIVSLKTNG